MYGSQTILESSQAPPPNNCLRSVHCHYRSLYLIYYNSFLKLFDLPTFSRPPQICKSHFLEIKTKLLDASINLIIYKKKKLQDVRRELKKKSSKRCYLRSKWGFSEYLILVLVLVFNLIHLFIFNFSYN
jgi:hypothetical protein